MKRLLALWFALILSGFAQADLDALQRTFESQRDKIIKARDVDVALAGEAYTGHLGTLLGKHQGAGNFKEALALKSEKERWERDLELEEKHINRDVADLRSLQEQFQRRLLAIHKKHASQFLSLASAYNTRLKSLQRSLTKAGKLDDATDVQTHIDRLAKSDGVTQSQHVMRLAAAEAKAAAPAKPAAPAAGAAAPVARTFRGSDKARVGDRFEAIWDHLMDKEIDAAMKYLNPTQVAEAGQAAIRPFIVGFSDLVQLGKPVGLKPSGGKIEYLNPEKTRLQLIPRMTSNFGAKDGDPNTWILVNGDWHLELD